MSRASPVTRLGRRPHTLLSYEPDTLARRLGLGVAGRGPRCFSSTDIRCPVVAELFAEHRAFALLELAVLAVLLSLLLLLMPLLLPFHFSITRIAT